MKFSRNKYLPYYIIALLAIPLFFLNIYNVHPWGDDFSQYIKEALNIAHGKPYYQSGYIYNPYNTEYAPPQYPPGYPLLLAPVVKIWGISYTAFAYFNTCITILLYMSLFAYFSKRTSRAAALCLATTIIYSGYMLWLKANVLSDTACLLFITLYFLHRNILQPGRWRVLLLACLASAAVLTRSQAILLQAAELIYFSFIAARNIIKKRRLPLRTLAGHPSVAIAGFTFILSLLFDKLIFPTPLSAASFYDRFIVQVLHHSLVNPLKDNLALLAAQMSLLFHYDTSAVVSKTLICCVEGAVPAFVIMGFIISVSRKVMVDDVFFVLMCLLTLYLPVHDVRYFLPAIISLFYYTSVTLHVLITALRVAKKHLWAAGLSLLYLYTGAVYFKKSATEIPEGCIPQAKDLAAFSYIAHNVSDTSIIIFTKPRLLTLYTGKRTINTAWQLPPEKNKTIFDSLHIQYMLVADGLDDNYYKTYLRETQRPIDSTRIAKGYTLYKIR